MAVRRPRLAAIIAWSSLATFLTPCFLGLEFESLHLFVGGVALTIATLVTAWLIARPRSHAPGTITCGDPIVVSHAKGSISIPRSRVECGWAIPSKGTLELQLTRGERLSVRLADAVQGDALLSALGLDLSRRRVALSIGGAVQALFVTVVSLLGGLMVGPLMLGIVADEHPAIRPYLLAVDLAFETLVLALALAWFGPGSIVVGSDGVHIRRGLRRRFVPIGDIVHVEGFGLGAPPGSVRGVYFVSRDHRSYSVLDSSFAAEDALALTERIRAAMDAHARGLRTTVEWLARENRPLQAWREALTSIANGAVGYRSASVSRDELIRVLHDAGSAAEHRIGAAIAMASTRDPSAREQIRVAAAASANESMRAVLVQAADDDLDEPALTRALGGSH